MGTRAVSLKKVGDDFAWSLLDAAPDATLIMSDMGEIVFVNDRAADVFGWDGDELLGRVVEDLIPSAQRAVHRAHRTRFRAEPANRAMGAGFELRALHSNGTEFPVEVSLNPLWLDERLHVIAAVRDISDRVETEDQMHRVLRTLDATEDAVFIFDATTLRYSFVNDGACRLVRYTHEDLLKMTPLHLNPYTTESEYRRMIEDLVSGEEESLFRRSTLIRRDGTEVEVEKTLRSAPTGSDGTRWVIALARDITSRLETEAELEASRQAVMEAERIVAISDDRERIARDLHDTVIQRLFAEGLSLQGVLTKLQDERVRPRLESTVDALDLAIKDLRTAIFALHTRPRAIADGLRGQLLDMVSEAAPGLGFQPRLQFDGPIELLDESIVQQMLPVIREALSNIAKHAAANNVRVSIDAGSTDLTVTITDDGVGVPDQVLGGSGLANMVERARRLGGECTIQRGEDHGTVLRWRVPTADISIEEPVSDDIHPR